MLFILNLIYQKFLNYASPILKKGTDLVDKNFLTVSEFAKKAGVSRQAVYNRINSDLVEFKKLVGEKVFVDLACLDRFKMTDKQVDCKLYRQVSGKLDKQKNIDLSSLQNDLNAEKIKVAVLESELKLKDLLVSSLQGQLDKMLEQSSKREMEIDKFVDKLTQLLDQQQQLQLQLQAQLLPSNQQEKKSFWQRIFNK